MLWRMKRKRSKKQEEGGGGFSNGAEGGGRTMVQDSLEMGHQNLTPPHELGSERVSELSE